MNWILQEYKFFLVLSIIALAGILSLFFLLLQSQDVQDFDLSLDMKYNELLEANSQDRTLKDVLTLDDLTLLNNAGNNIAWLTLAWTAGDIEILDEFNPSTIPGYEITPPPGGEVKLFFSTTSPFTGLQNNQIDAIKITDIDPNGSYVDKGWDIGINGGKFYVFASETERNNAINDFYPTGTSFDVNIGWGVMEGLGLFVPLSTNGSFTFNTSNNDPGVIDTTDPVVTLLGPNPLQHTINTFYVDPWVIAIDNIDGDISNTASIDEVAVIHTTLGTYTVNISVTDTAGNITSLTRTVEVIPEPDLTIPTITLIGDNPLTLEWNETYTEPGATANDNIDGNITSDIVIAGDIVNTSVLWNYFVTYDVQDSSGNAALQQTREVIVEDTTVPTITLNGLPSYTRNIGQAFTDLGATADDTFDGDISGNIVVGGTVNTNIPGIYTLTYDVQDNSGNSAVQRTRTITVVDNEVPEITLTSGNIILNVWSTYTEPGYTAVDNVDGDITGDVVVSGTVNTNIPGIYTLSYNVSDAAGNDAITVQRIITVVDTVIPVITLTNGDLTISVWSTYTEPGYTATDNVDGNITGSVVVAGQVVNTSTPGTYTRTYNVQDSSGNNAVQRTRTITVVDNTVPVITLTSGNVTINIGGTYTEPGYTATDNVDGNITGNVVVAGTINTNVAGTYTRTYNVQDAAGNTATQRTRTITVVDPYVTINTVSTPNSLGIESGNISGLTSNRVIVVDLDATTPTGGTASTTTEVNFQVGTTETSTNYFNSSETLQATSNTSTIATWKAGISGSVLYFLKYNTSGAVRVNCTTSTMSSGKTCNQIYSEVNVGDEFKFVESNGHVIYATVTAKSDNALANGTWYKGLVFGNYRGMPKQTVVGIPYGSTLIKTVNNFVTIPNTSLDGNTEIDLDTLGLTDTWTFRYRVITTSVSSPALTPTINSLTIRAKN